MNQAKFRKLAKHCPPKWFLRFFLKQPFWNGPSTAPSEIMMNCRAKSMDQVVHIWGFFKDSFDHAVEIGVCILKCVSKSLDVKIIIQRTAEKGSWGLIANGLQSKGSLLFKTAESFLIIARSNRLRNGQTLRLVSREYRSDCKWRFCALSHPDITVNRWWKAIWSYITLSSQFQ